MSIKHNIKTKNMIAKCIPILYETAHTGYFDSKTIENATIEMISCDVICVGISVASILIRTETKNMSQIKSRSDCPQCKKDE
tara:strand:- start:2055 stop:2300 length:246 start_codon:yes stop_codon:yes gene_type:complete